MIRLNLVVGATKSICLNLTFYVRFFSTHKNSQHYMLITFCDRTQDNVEIDKFQDLDLSQVVDNSWIEFFL